MPDHGSSPATASDYTTSTGYFQVSGSLSDTNDLDYLKITVTNAVNMIHLFGVSYPKIDVGGVYRWAAITNRLVDINDVNIPPHTEHVIFGNTALFRYDNLPAGDYYVKISSTTFTWIAPDVADYVVLMTILDGQVEVDKSPYTITVPLLVYIYTPIKIETIVITWNHGLIHYIYTPIKIETIVITWNHGLIHYIYTPIKIETSMVYGVWPRGNEMYANVGKMVSQPIRRSNRIATFPAGVVGEIPSSAVTIDANPAIGKLMRLYDRTSGELVSETYTDALGNYKFSEGITVGDKYYVVAFEDEVSPTLEAKVNDFLDPQVSTYSL